MKQKIQCEIEVDYPEELEEAKKRFPINSLARHHGHPIGSWYEVKEVYRHQANARLMLRSNGSNHFDVAGSIPYIDPRVAELEEENKELKKQIWDEAITNPKSIVQYWLDPNKLSNKVVVKEGE